MEPLSSASQNLCNNQADLIADVGLIWLGVGQPHCNIIDQMQLAACERKFEKASNP